MITLDDVSAKEAILYGDYALYNLLNETHSESILDIKKLMDKYEEYDWFYSNKLLVKGLENMEYANNHSKNPEQYFVNKYSNDYFLFQDVLNKGDILLLDNPIKKFNNYQALKRKTIEDIKLDLSHTTFSGNNYLRIYDGSYKRFNKKEITRILKSIEMFQEQIERQAKLTNNYENNLFLENKEEKREIVEQSYKDIINFLLSDNNSKLIWSNLSDKEKKLYVESIISHNQKLMDIKNNVINYISNYTTLPELENLSNGEYQVLTRFKINK